MPLPGYVTNENVQFNSILDPAIVVSTSGTNKNIIVWANLAADGQALIQSFITAIGGALPVVAYSGYQIADFNGTIVGANPCGLATSHGYQIVNVGGAHAGGDSTGLTNDATVYVATVVVDGTPITVNVTGSAAQTYTTLINEINTDLGVSATASLSAGNILITSASTGSGSSIRITDSNTKNDLFGSLTTFVNIQNPVDGFLYTTNVIVDGTTYAITFASSGSNTYNDIITALNTALGVNATAAIVGGNIKITSATTGNVSTVLIDRIYISYSEPSIGGATGVEASLINSGGFGKLSRTDEIDVDHSLFRNMTGFKTYKTPINGATGLTEAMQLNYVPMSTSLNYTNDFANGETFYNLWKGLIQFLPPKPTFATMGAGGSGFSDTSVAWYDPAGGGARSWRYLINDVAANPPPA